MKGKYIVLLAVALCAGLVLFIQTYRHKQRQTAANEERRQRTAELVALKSQEWSQRPFAPISQGSAAGIRSAMDKAKECSILSPDQRSRLAALLEKFFRCYETGSFEDYYAFRTAPGNYRIDFTELAIFIPAEVKPLANSGASVEELERIWRRIHQESGQPEPAKISSVDFAGLMFKVRPLAKAESPTVGASLGVLKNVARKALPPFVNYAATPQRIVERDGTVMTATIGFIGHFSSTENPGPVHATFYWDPQENGWYPWDMVTDSSSRFLTVF